jgi:tRNA (mo5U34)-methyltransferase
MSTLPTLQSPGVAEGPLAAEIAALGPWFHNLHLPGEIQTAPDHPFGDFPRWKWEQLAPLLPEDLHGATALDIGCNAGFYSFELARRGADVLAIDSDPHYLRQAEWARRRLPGGQRMRLQQAQVYDLARMPDRFDLVLFMGVFYHLRYPLLALDIVARRVRERLVFQSLSLRDDGASVPSRSLGWLDMDALNDPGWPKMAFIEHELAGDPTNWWIPNQACMEAMLRSAGLEVEARPGHELIVCRPTERPAAGAEQYAAVLGAGAPHLHHEGAHE